MKITVVGKRGSGKTRRAARLARMIVISACRLSAHVFAQTRGGQGDFGFAAMAHTPGWPNSANLTPQDGTSASCHWSHEPGLHTLLVRQGQVDPAPVEVTVPVVLPALTDRPLEWVKASASNRVVQWALGVPGLALPAALTLGGTVGCVDYRFPPESNVKT